LTGPTDPELMDDANRLIALARVGQPSEVAVIIAWLISDEAGYAIDAHYPIDRGQMCL
jgi:NAD(P)-dependent dehydrogenase (short-subunit alcohol dehydrogenase family)